METVDLIVLGAGAAGLTAAATAAAAGVEVLVIECLAPGGQVASVDRIANFPGFAEGISGYELGPLLQERATAAGADMLVDRAERIERVEGGFLVTCAENTVRGAAVILATGSHRRKLGVPGEEEFEGRGVSHCASCDAYFFQGKAVVVAGGGDSAFDEAEVIAEQAERVVIVHRGPQPVAQRQIVQRVSALANVAVLADAEVVAIEGNGEVERISIDLPAGRHREDAAGIFVNVGLVPNSELAAGLAERDEDGRLLAGAEFQTRCPGLFVAGDLRSGATAMLANAAEDGASAAQSAVAYLRRTAGTRND